MLLLQITRIFAVSIIHEHAGFVQRDANGAGVDCGLGRLQLVSATAAFDYSFFRFLPMSIFRAYDGPLRKKSRLLNAGGIAISFPKSINEINDGFIELVRFFPEQHVAAVLKQHGFGTGDVFPYPGAAMVIEHLALFGTADQRGQIDMGDEVPPIQVRMIPHDFDAHIGRAFADFIHQELAVFRRGFVLQAGAYQAFCRASRVALGRKAGQHEGFHIEAGLLSPGPIRLHILGRRLVHTDEAVNPVTAEQFNVAPQGGGPHGPA